ARRNAITHGMTARTILPVLPQEDPKELEDRTQRAIAAMKPRNPLELDLVCRAVRLAGELDRAERVATAHLAHRVRMATRSGTDTVSAEELSRVHDLGSKLFFQAGIGPGYSSATADDYPAVIVRRLEESAEGCRWLLARWAEILNLLDREAAWDDPEIVRFVGLLGTLETLRKMRKEEFGTMRKEELGTGNGEGEKADCKCQVADDRGQMADDRGQMADDECQVAEGDLQVAGGELKMGDEQREVQADGCDEGQSSEPMTEGSSGSVVGHDSQRVSEDATDDKIGILSHEGAHAAGQPGQGDGVGQCLPYDVTTPQKAPNKANLESKQIMESQELKSETAGAEGRKQSQSSKEETRRKPRSRDDRAARQSSRRPVASEAEGSGPAPRSSEASGNAPGD